MTGRSRAATGEGQPAPSEGEQYFTTNPGSPDERKTIEVTLVGHQLPVQVSRGVFSAGRLDLGTSVLLKRVPKPPESGNFLDLGCGWGPISLSMGLLSPEAKIFALDINQRALDLTRQNAQSTGLNNICVLTPEQVPSNLALDLIWSNPPIRIGKEALHTLLMTYLPRLKTGGMAYLVVQRNLGADSLMTWLKNRLGSEWSIRKFASAKGYRIIEVGRV